MPSPTCAVVKTDARVSQFLAGIQPGSRLHDIRAQRPETRENAQLSYLALFKPHKRSGGRRPSDVR